MLVFHRGEWSEDETIDPDGLEVEYDEISGKATYYGFKGYDGPELTFGTPVVETLRVYLRDEGGLERFVYFAVYGELTVFLVDKVDVILLRKELLPLMQLDIEAKKMEMLESRIPQRNYDSDDDNEIDFSR